MATIDQMLLFAGNDMVRAQGVVGKTSKIATSSERDKKGEENNMDRCHAEKATQNSGSHLNSVDVRQDERKAKRRQH
jgi:hypothetical protein